MGLGRFGLENHLGDSLHVETDEDGSLVLVTITGRAGETRTPQILGTLKPTTFATIRINMDVAEAHVFIDDKLAIKSSRNIPTGLCGVEAKTVWL